MPQEETVLEEPSKELQEGVAEKPKQSVAPPIGHLKKGIQLTVNPARDTVLELASGSTLKVEANTIVTMSGAVVKTPIQIQLNEVRKASEIILSGAPMRYFDENGEENWMETAGMFEIQAFSQGEMLKIAEGKAIQVDFASQTDQNVGFWHFDEALGNWVNLEINPPVAKRIALKPTSEESGAFKEQLSGSVSTDQQQIKDLPPAINAVLGNPKKILPPFKIDYHKYPSLKEFRNLEWEYAGADPEKNPRNSDSFYEPWSNITIEKASSTTYELTFSRADETLVVPVRPCFRRAKDLAAFNESMAAYEEQRTELKAKQDKQKQQAKFAEQQNNFIRSATISKFGVYNWDALIKLREAVRFRSEFDFGIEIPEHLQNQITVFLITGKKDRSVIKFPKYDWAHFSFVPSMNNKMIAILPGGKAAVFLQKDFNRESASLLEANNGMYRFKMRLIPETIKEIEDLEKILG